MQKERGSRFQPRITMQRRCHDFSQDSLGNGEVIRKRIRSDAVLPMVVGALHPKAPCDGERIATVRQLKPEPCNVGPDQALPTHPQAHERKIPFAPDYA
jgi:hypothetical protein